MSKFNVELKSYEELFTTQEQRDDMKREKVHDVQVADLVDFPNHPFHVLKDDELMQVVSSVKESGVLMPALGREVGDKIELISGHRRKLACEILGIETMPVIVREMSDDEAVIAMVDSNIQREHILPSEKAFAYKMKIDALKHQGKPTCGQLVHKSRDSISEEESGRQISRCIRLTNLIPQLLEKVDSKQIAFSPAVELSYLSENEQTKLLDSMELNDCTPSHAQAIRLKKLSQENSLTDDILDEILSEEKANQVEQYKFPKNDIRKFFPKSYTDNQIQDTLFKLLEQWQKKRERDRDSR